MSFVNKAYLTEYYNIYTFSTDELKNNLYEEKKQFLTTSGENVSYKDIKKAIFKTLEQLNLAAVNRPGFATSYAIVMGNISNLK